MSQTTPPWSPQIHQNAGGSTAQGPQGFHNLMWADQQINVVTDHISARTQDASEFYAWAIGGTVTPGDVVGFDAVLAGQTWQVRYTVQPGDILTSIATKLATIMAGGTTPDGQTQPT